MPEEIKAIPTHYKGYKFRSRLEARLAVFFEHLRVKWVYETEGFVLPSGKCYLPDFKVICHGLRGSTDDEPFVLWIEVKGPGTMTVEDAEKIREFAGIKVKHAIDNNTSYEYEYWEIENPILVINEIPDPDTYPFCVDLSSMCGISPFNYELIDGDWFGAYPAADKHGHFYLWGDEGNYINREDIDRVRSALIAARSARFEHGETPETNHIIYANGVPFVNGIPF